MRHDAIVDTKAREIYAADLIKRPTYHDGSKRKTFDQLALHTQDRWRRFAAELLPPPHFTPAVGDRT